ncbi:hypothetical protein MMC21_006191 [Puttea exsequens]|nr:hypothetical protein [Puttea exsequens]
MSETQSSSEDDTKSEIRQSESNGFDASSPTSGDYQGSRRVTKKRKIEDDSIISHSRVKRFKGHYNDAYRQLYNTTVSDTALLQHEADDPLLPSQIGISYWSSEEKTTFFRALSRKGRHDIRAIAAAICSKSEPEVQIYLGLLYKAAADHYVHDSTQSLFRLFDLEPAVELSRECCEALDRAADALRVLQQRADETNEKKRHPDYPLLDPKVARLVGRHLRDSEIHETELTAKLPSVALLNLKNFLALSKRVFMNSKDAEYNWRTYTERRRPPSILNTAFSDFHNLVLSVTRRLVQSSLFSALSRLRATTAPGGYVPCRHVKQCDVVAALNILDMRPDGRSIWARVARKCKLRVYENVRGRQVSGKRYSYGEVEEILNSRGRRRFQSVCTDPFNGRIVSSDDRVPPAPQQASENSSPPHSSSINDESSIQSSPNHSKSPISTSPAQSPISRIDRLSEAQDTYAEHIDQFASHEEETHLWQFLGQTPSRLPPEKEKIPFSKAPYAHRKDREDLTDWTTWIEHAAEWETFSSPVPEQRFTSNRKGTREGEDGEGMTSDDGDSDVGGEWVGEVSSGDDSLLSRRVRRKGGSVMDWEGSSANGSLGDYDGSEDDVDDGESGDGDSGFEDATGEKETLDMDGRSVEGVERRIDLGSTEDREEG